MTNFFLEKWGRKFTFKLLQSIQPFVQVIVGKIANTEASTQLIGSAIGAAVLGCIDVIISYLTHGQAQSLQKIQEEEESLTSEVNDIRTQPTSQLTLTQALAAPDIVPVRTWVMEVDGGTNPRRRRYFGSLADAASAGIAASKDAPNADINIYEPGDALP